MFKFSKLVRKTTKIVVVVSMLVPAAMVFAKPTQAAEQNNIWLPRTYTWKNIHRVKDRGRSNRYANTLQKTIVYDSRDIMLDNGFYDDNTNDSRTINLERLDKSDYQELNRYAIGLINSVRRQLGVHAWGTNYSIQRVAKDDAKFYERDNVGDDNADDLAGNGYVNEDGHDTRAVNDAARINGIKTDYGYNDYEDYTGFYCFRTDSPVMTMHEAKNEIYFAMKSFLTGPSLLGDGVSDNNELVIQLNNPVIYREWDHARDLSSRGYSQVGTSFSSRNGQEVSFHIYSIHNHDIKNAKRYYRNSNN